MTDLCVLSSGSGVTFQDFGRPGLMSSGISEGGAVDPIALQHARILLSDPALPAIEMAGFGGKFQVDGAPAGFALTGARMRATLDGAPLMWSACHVILPGQILEIGPALEGNFGYLSFAGGLDVAHFMGSASTHATANIGCGPNSGDRIGLRNPTVVLERKLPNSYGHSNGEVRFLAGPQTGLFDASTVDAFCKTAFERSSRGNRMGVELLSDAVFSAEGGLNVVSEPVIAGDIQISGAGVPFVLGPECQTTGGYPRIGTVIPSDLPRVFQASAGSKLNFRMVGRDEAMSALRLDTQILDSARPEALIRDPSQISDLLAYQLVDGFVRGDEA